MEIWLTVRYVRIARWGDCEGRAEMNRDEAIAIIRKEYLCVDRDCDIERSCGKCDLMIPSKEPILEAYKMALKALEREQKTGHWEQYGNSWEDKWSSSNEYGLHF